MDQNNQKEGRSVRGGGRGNRVKKIKYRRVVVTTALLQITELKISSPNRWASAKTSTNTRVIEI